MLVWIVYSGDTVFNSSHPRYSSIDREEMRGQQYSMIGYIVGMYFHRGGHPIVGILLGRRR